MPAYPAVEPRTHLLPTNARKGPKIVKMFVITLLVSFGFAYLALCACGIACTGSTAGLADIGNAAFPWRSPPHWRPPCASIRPTARIMHTPAPEPAPDPLLEGP